jgi:hypothetical protein
VAGGKEGKTWDVCWPGLVPFVTLVWKPPKIDKTSNSVKNAIKRFQIALWASYWVFYAHNELLMANIEHKTT